jgi:phosphoglycerate dehydrogenase-like enzyme
VYSDEAQARLHELVDFDESLIPESAADKDAYIRSMEGAEVAISTWQGRAYDEELLRACPELKLILYGAGSVKHFVTDALIEKGVTVCSAVHLNAQPVAEFTLGLILTALKDVFGLNRSLHEQGPAAWHKPSRESQLGYYRTKLGLLGMGRVSAHLISLLRPFDMQVYLNDPNLGPNDYAELGVQGAEEDWILAHCDVVSLHHGNIPRLEKMLNAEKLDLLKPGAHFINTARGKLVDEDALVRRLRKGDITAYLDVTYPEPPEEGHPFYELPNCVLTPHIAGSIGTETHRMGDYCVRELENWLNGRELENPVDLATVFDRG